MGKRTLQGKGQPHMAAGAVTLLKLPTSCPLVLLVPVGDGSEDRATLTGDLQPGTVPITALHLAKGLPLPGLFRSCVSFSTHRAHSRTTVCPTKTPVNSQQS